MHFYSGHSSEMDLRATHPIVRNVSKELSTMVLEISHLHGLNCRYVKKGFMLKKFYGNFYLKGVGLELGIRKSKALVLILKEIL